VVLAANASWVFRFTPYLVFGTAVLVGGIIPMLSVDLPLASTADVVGILGLFGLARFFTALAGMDVGTAVGGIVSSLAEPATLMAIFTISLGSASTSLAQIVQSITAGQSLLRPSFSFALIAFVMIALAETGRIPVDNPSTHLELTMIHEAMILEYSGRHLALLEWAGMMKLLLFSLLGIACFMPWGIAGFGDLRGIPLALLALLAKLAAIGAGVVLIETGLAKMRIFRLTEYLGAAFLVATLGMISFFILE
jgi:formate hydrogenlyase subunit 4